MTDTIHTTRRALLTAVPMLGLTAASTAAPLPGPAAGEPVHHLAALFEQSVARWQGVVDAEYDIPNWIPDDLLEVAIRGVLDVVDLIETTPFSMDGLRLRAAALSWCMDAWRYDGAYQDELGERDQRLVGQLVLGLTGKPCPSLIAPTPT